MERMVTGMLTFKFNEVGFFYLFVSLYLEKHYMKNTHMMNICEQI